MKRNTKFLTALTLTALTFTSCANLFDSKIAMVTTGNIANLNSLVVPETTIDKLDAPAQIYVSQSESPSTIIVTWSKVEGATSYYLERAVSTTKDAN